MQSPPILFAITFDLQASSFKVDETHAITTLEPCGPHQLHNQVVALSC
jgi:hypothetical protein